MRASDVVKNPFKNSHDQQIGLPLHDTILMWLYGELERRSDLVEIITRKTGAKLHKKEIESPIMNSNYILGFTDLLVEAKYKRFYTDEEFERAKRIGDFKWADTIKREKFYIDSAYGHVEVKSKVDIGETIRQIKYYRTSPWTVCAPPFAQAEILIEQGINFIPYDPQEDFY